MRRTIGLVVVAVVCVMSVPTVGGAQWAPDPESGELPPGVGWSRTAVDGILDDLARLSVEDPPAEPVGEISYLQPGDKGYKSPGRAFFMSLLIPGSGELYSGSIRGLAFLGIEILSWTGYMYYDGKGEDERNNYQAFADLHYDPARYRDVINEVCGKYENYPDAPGWPCTDCEYEHCAEDLDPGSDYSENRCEMVRGHFLLPEHKGQHYYEDLGKYDKYIFGWDDWYSNYEPVRDGISWATWVPGEPWPTLVPPWDESVGMSSANREKYREMRQQSNDYLDRATYFTWFVLINHVGSALDAAFTARKHNRKLAGHPTSVDVGMDARPLGDELETRIYLRKRF
jgi:hypothetical protein